MPPAIASFALLIAKLWDVVNDPLFGYMCDRTKSRFGRRRVYLIYGAAPFALSAASLWMMPSGLSSANAFIWILVSYTVYDTLFTLIAMPYAALGADLTKDYDDRTSLIAISSVGALIGYVLGTVLLPKLVGLLPNAQQGYYFVGALMGLIAGGSIGMVAWFIKEPPSHEHQRQPDSLLRAMKATFKTRPFVILSLALGFARLGLTLLSTSIAFFIAYRMQLGKDGLPMFMGILLATVAVTIPFWKWICSARSKGMAYAMGILVCAIGLGLTFLIGPNQKPMMIGVVILIGFGMGAHFVAPHAMLPDVVDFSEVQTGERRTGVYYGVFGLIDKLSRTFGFAAVGWWLDWFNYVPNLIPQSAEAEMAIRLITGPIPAVAMLLALPLLFLYPLNRATHESIRAKLDLKLLNGLI